MVAKRRVGSETVNPPDELSLLRQEYQKLLNEYNNLKSNKRFGDSFDTNNLDPLDVLGFNVEPDQDELKKRYRQLAQKLHPDKDGSNFLMQLVQNAYEQIKSKNA